MYTHIYIYIFFFAFSVFVFFCLFVCLSTCCTPIRQVIPVISCKCFVLAGQDVLEKRLACGVPEVPEANEFVALLQSWIHCWMQYINSTFLSSFMSCEPSVSLDFFQVIAFLKLTPFLCRVLSLGGRCHAQHPVAHEGSRMKAAQKKSF